MSDQTVSLPRYCSPFLNLIDHSFFKKKPNTKLKPNQMNAEKGTSDIVAFPKSPLDPKDPSAGSGDHLTPCPEALPI